MQFPNKLNSFLGGMVGPDSTEKKCKISFLNRNKSN